MSAARWSMGDRVEVEGYLLGADEATWLPGTIERFEDAHGGYLSETWRAVVALDEIHGVQLPRRVTRYAKRDGTPVGPTGTAAEIRALPSPESPR